MVCCTLSQVFDSYVASFHDLESEHILEEPLDVVIFSSNEENDDYIDDLYILEDIYGIYVVFILMEIPFMMMINNKTLENMPNTK
jgi:hypothetical protein